MSDAQAHAESDALHERVVRFARASMTGDPRELFDAIALDVARFQARNVAPVGRLSAARGVDLATATSADDIAAVPADAFRFARVAAHLPADNAVVFRTSGTSLGAETRGAHPMRRTSTYEAVSLAWADRLLFTTNRRDFGLRDPLLLASLVPSRRAAPESSLSFMVSAFARVYGRATWHVDGDRLDVASLEIACEEAREAGVALAVFGTSFSFVHLLDGDARADLTLPSGSRVMQTGGFKGRAREVDAADMRRAIAARFGVPTTHVVGEYGMTELSSQLYEGTLTGGEPGVYLGPPWLRVTAVDPVTLAPVARGDVGIARFVDLANVDSSVAVQTADLVRIGERGGVELLGRAPGATPRGCSIAIDMMLSGPK